MVQACGRDVDLIRATLGLVSQRRAARLTELEFHSRGNIEKLAELSLTIEDELKQKAFVESIGAVYSAQDAFQSKILALIADYEAECARLKPAG